MVPIATIKPGGGGTFPFFSPTGNHAAQSAASPSQLPRTGGAAGHGSSPLGPLAFLATLAIAAGRLLPRIFKR
ncbi:MAG: hypothetical protein ACR2JC_14790 [Chloroflexota bacterium]